MQISTEFSYDSEYMKKIRSDAEALGLKIKSSVYILLICVALINFLTKALSIPFMIIAGILYFFYASESATSTVAPSAYETQFFYLTLCLLGILLLQLVNWLISSYLQLLCFRTIMNQPTDKSILLAKCKQAAPRLLLTYLICISPMIIIGAALLYCGYLDSSHHTKHLSGLILLAYIPIIVINSLCTHIIGLLAIPLILTTNNSALSAISISIKKMRKYFYLYLLVQLYAIYRLRYKRVVAVFGNVPFIADLHLMRAMLFRDVFGITTEPVNKDS